jgi:hypothetical protein
MHVVERGGGATERMITRVRLPKALAPLIKKRRWVGWKWELRTNPDGSSKWSKPPISLRTRRKIDVTDRTNWVGYDEAAAATGCDGIGFVLLGSGIGALDLDDCRSERTGRLDNWARQIIAKSDGAYCEITPSGEGLRIIGTAKGDPVHTNWRIGRGRIEIFRDAQRYITVTGDQLGDCDRLSNIDDLIDDLLIDNGAVRKRKVVIVRRRISPLTPREICRKHEIYGKLGWYLLYGEPVIGQRSTVHFWMARCLLEREVPTSEMFVLLKNTAWNKHRYEARCDRMVWTLIERAAAMPITPWRPS